MSPVIVLDLNRQPYLAGGMSLDLAKQFPNLRFIVQDRPHVVPLAEKLWEHEMPQAVNAKRVEFMAHDFFKEQPIRGAEVYLMRYIMYVVSLLACVVEYPDSGGVPFLMIIRHNWDNERCLQILAGLTPALINSNSRILISDQVIVTTAPTVSGSATHSAHGLHPVEGFAAGISEAPYPLLRNYGYASRFKHMRDLSMMTLMNGHERTLEEWVWLAETAGLRLEKVWECRGVVWIIELRR